MVPSHRGTCEMDRPVPWLLLLLPVAAFTNEQCPMNVSRPTHENAYQVNDVLWAGEPKKAYQPAEYRSVPGGGYVLCTCETEKCVRKCCPQNWAYVEGNCSALNASLGDQFEVAQFVNENGTVSAYETGLFHLVNGKMNCTDNFQSNSTLKKYNNFRISKAGMLLNESGDTIASPGEFCLDLFSTFDSQTIPVVCPRKQITNKADEHICESIGHITGMILSLPFLFLTFLVYAHIRDLRNLHGKSLMCHVATLLVAYTNLVIVRFVTDYADKKWCVFLAYTVQLSFVASFFWLNVMCFDLWWTFSGFRPLSGITKENESKKFIIYSLYAWGSTTLMAIFTFGMEEYSPPYAIRPEFEIESCWFGSRSATLLYFYGPIGILLFSNLLMFIHVAILIVKQMRYAKELLGSETRKRLDHEKQQFMLYLKLFIVMGVNWSIEIISWATGSDGTELIWCIPDIINTLQGVWIFLIFVCKKNVYNLIIKKLYPRFQLVRSPTLSTTINNYNPSENSSNTQNKNAFKMLPYRRKT